MTDEMQTAQRRAMQYSFVDGSVEFFLGGLCLLLGVYFYISSRLTEGTLFSIIFNVSLVLVVIGGGLLVNRLLKAFKERITYPRTGFVAYRRAKGSRRILHAVLSGLIAMLVSALVTTLFTNAELGAAWMPTVTGIIYGLVLAFIAYRSTLLRMYLLGLIAVVLGGGLMLFQVGDILGLAIFYGLMAVVFFLSGGCTLWLYLRSTPLPEASDES